MITMEKVNRTGRQSDTGNVFVDDPISAIDIIHHDKKPLVVILQFDTSAEVSRRMYDSLNASLIPYGGKLGRYEPFFHTYGYNVDDPNKAKMLVNDWKDGRIPHVSDLFIESLTAQLCFQYSFPK